MSEMDILVNGEDEPINCDREDLDEILAEFEALKENGNVQEVAYFVGMKIRTALRTIEACLYTLSESEFPDRELFTDLKKSFTRIVDIDQTIESKIIIRDDWGDISVDREARKNFVDDFLHFFNNQFMPVFYTSKDVLDSLPKDNSQYYIVRNIVNCTKLIDKVREKFIKFLIPEEINSGDIDRINEMLRSGIDPHLIAQIMKAGENL